MADIKNLLFDLGGVIMDIRKERCVAAFEKLGLQDAPAFFGDASQKGPFMAVERGDISPAEFHDKLRPLLRPGVSDSEMDAAFCQFLIGIPLHRLKSLRELAGRYNVGLLSNTNPIMWNSKIKEEFEQDGHTAEYYFPGGLVTSFEANALKPEEKIFNYAIEHTGFKPEETLFLDDAQVNLDAAARLGFHTALVAPGTEFTDILKSMGL